MSSLSQYEINMQVSATIEKIALELARLKSNNITTLSQLHSNNISIGDISKLFDLSDYGYDCYINSDYSIDVPDKIRMDLAAKEIKITVLNHEGKIPSDFSNVFKMTYDFKTGIIVTTYLCNLYIKYRDTEENKIVMLYFKGSIDNDTNLVTDTKLWLMNKVDNSKELLYPQWSYIYSAKTVLFPIENLTTEEGVYGPYTLSNDDGLWSISNENSLSAFIYKSLKEGLSSTGVQNFTNEQIKQLWSNLQLGDPDIDFIDVFNHTFATGQTVYFDINKLRTPTCH